MKLYQKQGSKLSKIRDQPFKLEKDIQKLTEENLEVLFNLRFVASEYSLNNLRIDTLGFDPDNNAFVIIEYKKDRNFSVIDQGYAYLALLLNNKADFILEYNENSGNSLKKTEVDWSQSQIIFVAPSFTTYQREAINFRDLPIELWEVKQCENGTVAFNEIKAANAQESIQKVSKKSGTVEDVSREVKVYSEDHHVSKGTDRIKEFYQQYRGVLLSWEGVEIKSKKKSIAFKTDSIFADFIVQKSNIKIIINLKKGRLDDPKKITNDMANIGHWGNGDYQVRVNDNEEFDYIISLVKQSYKIHQR